MKEMIRVTINVFNIKIKFFGKIMLQKILKISHQKINKKFF